MNEDRTEWRRDRDRQAMAFGLGAAALCAVDSGMTRKKWLTVCAVAWEWTKQIERPKENETG